MMHQERAQGHRDFPEGQGKTLQRWEFGRRVTSRSSATTARSRSRGRFSTNTNGPSPSARSRAVAGVQRVVDQMQVIPDCAAPEYQSKR